MTKYGYTRVSSKSQENNSSLEGQKHRIKKQFYYGLKFPLRF